MIFRQRVNIPPLINEQYNLYYLFILHLFMLSKYA